MTGDTKKRAPIRGRPNREGEKPTCSIPAKYETVLFTGPREKKGFGSEGRRFGSDETENPGPGTYSLPAAQRRPAESTSKKGYGPMVSQSQRFKHKVRYTGPGPGEYPVHADGSQAFFHVSATSSFHPKVSKIKDVSLSETPLPGPGEYNSTITRTGQHLDLLSAPQTHHSSFKAPGHKVQLLGNTDAPAPTKYTLADPWEASSKAASRAGSHACTSSFAARSAASLNSIPPVVFLDTGSAGSVDAPDTGPGPGTYSQDQNSFQTTLARAAVKPSAAFRTPEHVDRMGRPLVPPQRPQAVSSMHVGRTGSDNDAAHDTGPGAGPWDASHAKGVSAPFKSKVPGHAGYTSSDLHDLARAPGPAYYGDAKAPPSTKSFHINAKKKFVGLVRAG